MGKRTDNPNVEVLAQKDIFAKVADGDWYQFAQEPEMQAIVKQSAMAVHQLNDMAKANLVLARQQLYKLCPHLDRQATIEFPITTIEHPIKLQVMAGTKIALGFQFLSAAMVTIGHYCIIGPRFQIYTPNHHPHNKDLRRNGWQYDLPVTIGDDCLIGGSVIILPGITIGNNVVIIDGSVVTKNLPSNVIVAGDPAQVIGKND